MRVAVVADIGRSSFHLGDEAIAYSTVALLRSRGLNPVLFSHDPGLTNKDYPDTDVRSAIVLPDDPASQVTAMLAVEQYFSGNRHAFAGYPALADVVTDLQQVDAVLVAGGGNLSSAFGALLYERLIMLRIGQGLGIPTLVSGQTIGPILTSHDAHVAGPILARAQFVGVRDASSLDLLGSLLPESGQTCALGIDDATFFATKPPATTLQSGSPRPDRRIVVSLAPTASLSGRDAVLTLASDLDRIVEATDSDVIFLPHQGHKDCRDIDVALHDQIANVSSTGRLTSLPMDATAIDEALEGADLVISSRFHGVVFGLARAIPTIGLFMDGYGERRMSGVMAHWGMTEWAVPALGLRPGDVSSLALLAIEEGPRIRERLSMTAQTLRVFHSAWWDAITEVIRGGLPAFPSPPVTEQYPAPEFIRVLRQTGSLAAEFSTQRDREYLERVRGDGATSVFLGEESVLVAARDEADRSRERACRERDLAQALNDQFVARQRVLETELEVLRRKLA